MTDIRKTGTVSSTAAASRNSVDNNLLESTKSFITSFISEMSQDQKLMEKVGRLDKVSMSSKESTDPLLNDVFKNLSSSLMRKLKNSDEPGGKFLRSLFSRFKGKKTSFLNRIPEILIWVSISGDNAQGKTIRERGISYINMTTNQIAQKLHSDLLKESPYIYKEVCQETRTGRKVVSRLSRFRERAGIRTAAKKPARVGARFRISAELIQKTEELLRTAALGLIRSNNLLEFYKIEAEIERTQKASIEITKRFSKASAGLQNEMETELAALLKYGFNSPELEFLKEIINTHPEAKKELLLKISLLTRDFVALSKNRTELVMHGGSRSGDKSLGFAQNILENFAQKYPEVYQRVVLKIPAAEIKATKTKEMPRSRSLRDVLNRPPAVVEKGKRFERVKTRVFKI